MSETPGTGRDRTGDVTNYDAVAEANAWAALAGEMAGALTSLLEHYWIAISGAIDEHDYRRCAGYERAAHAVLAKYHGRKSI